MKRLFKRIISSVIVSITVLNILLPIIPEGILNINAAEPELLYNATAVSEQVQLWYFTDSSHANCKSFTEYNFPSSTSNMNDLSKDYTGETISIIDNIVQYCYDINVEKDYGYGFSLLNTLDSAEQSNNNEFSIKGNYTTIWDLASYMGDGYLIGADYVAENLVNSYVVSTTLAYYSESLSKYIYVNMLFRDSQVVGDGVTDSFDISIYESLNQAKVDLIFYTQKHSGSTEYKEHSRKNININCSLEDLLSTIDSTKLLEKVSESVITGNISEDISSELELLASITEASSSIVSNTDITLKFGSDTTIIQKVYHDEPYAFITIDHSEFNYFEDVSQPLKLTITSEFLNFGDTGDLVEVKTGTSEPGDKVAITCVGWIIEAITRTNIPDNDTWYKKAEKFSSDICSKYPGTIFEIIPLFLDEMYEHHKLWQLDGAGVNITEESYPELTEEDSFEIMSNVLGLSIGAMVGECDFNQQGEIKIDNDTKRIKLSWSGELGTADYNLSDIWSMLTEYERAVLSETYNIICDYRLKGSNTIKSINQVLSYNYIDKLEYDDKISQELSSKEQFNIESIQDVVSKRDKDIINTRSVYNVARNANSLGQYIIGIGLYHEEDSGNEVGIYSIYDETLHGLYHLNYEWSDVNQVYFPAYLLNNLGILTQNVDVGGKEIPLLAVLNNEDGEDLKTFLMYLYNLTYSFDVAAFSEGAEKEGYKPEDIRKVLEGDTSADSTLKELLSCFTEQTNFKNWKSAGNMNVISEFDDVADYDFSIGMIRSIIELHDFCEFLELLNANGELKAGIIWTPAIQEYLKLYSEYEDIFNAFRNNEHIYAQAPEGRQTDTEPLGEFFNIENQQLTDNWIKGFSLSSQFVPMETNLYDANSITIIEDEDWISDFYYKYAFFRKALYINTDNSALVNEFISNEESTTRVCTLRDLLNYDRDIILTLDDNFYNADDISDAIKTLDYTALRQNTDAQEEQTGQEKVVDWVKGAFALAPEQILKTDNEIYYSDTIATNCTKLGADEPEKWNVIENIINAYILTYDDIMGEDSVLNDYEYSVRQSYAVVSAIYRSASLYNETLKSIVSDNAIFKSSKSICYTPGTGKRDWLALYNYYMLANLEEQMKNDAASTLDLDAPIFCDIFGNIITESGLVIIPAAANATLCGEKWNPYTIGWSEYYNNGNRIKGGQFSDDVYSWLLGYDYSQSEVDENGQIILSSTERVKEAGGGYFELDRSGDLILRTTSLTSNGLSAIIQWDTLNKNSTIIQQLFFNNAYFDKGKDLYGLKIVNLVVETLRGAPIEHIDYMFEGLDGNMNISKYGVYMAYKLEELTDSLVSGTNGNEIGGNSIVTMPNLAFMSGVEYIVLYAFKIVFAVCVVGFAISLYMDSVVNSLGIKSVGKFVITLLCVIAALTLVPNLMNWSYYKANKDILSSEVGYIMMLNYCKEFDGSEIGITSVKTPETQTELYLKVDDISVDWWDILDDVLFKNTFQTVSELYADQMDNNAMQGLPGVKTKGDGLYIDIQDVYNSTNLNYLPSTNVLKNTVYGSGSRLGSVDTVASFTVPYYAILEQLVANINEYNVQRDITAYSYSVGANGSVLTYDIIAPYLKSNEFLSDGYDIMGLDRILNLDNHRLCYNFAFNQSDIEQMKLSQWYPTEMYTENMRAESVNRIYDKARTYVAENAELIGKVPDEVFLKVMAMQMAIEFNREFNAPYGRSIEIMNIDTRDLARFMVSDRASMYKYFSYGYARYTYEEAGSLGVIFAGMFIAILWLTSFVKPMLIIFIIGIFTINVVFRKLLFRKESKAFEGYLIGCACLCLVNYAYAGMLKVSLNIANTGLGSITALACALIIQIVYIATLIGIARIVVKDWQNNGYGEFLNIGSGIIANVNHANKMIVDKLVSRGNQAYAATSSSRRYSGEDVDMETIDDMLDRDAEREERGTFSPA